MYVVLSRSTSMRVGGGGATSAVMPGGGAVALILEQAPRLILVRQRFDEHVEIAVEHALQLMQRDVDTMVGHARLREVVRPDLLAAIAAAHQRSPRRLQLGVALCLREVIQ